MSDDVGRSDGRPPLVLLHGLTFDRQMWRPTLAELEAIDPGRRAIAIDLPGHGDSPDAPSYLPEATAERVHDAVEAAGLVAPVVVGHSAAAGTAFLYGVTYPSSGVVMVEGSMQLGGFARLAQATEPVLRGTGFDEAFGRILANTFGLDEVSPEVRDFVRATSRPRRDVVLGTWQLLFQLSPAELDAMVDGGAARVRALGLPFASVVGHDPSPEEVAWTAAHLPGARIEVWPHSGHFPHLAHPGRFARLLADTAMWHPHGVAPVATVA
jgi:pimeloyl-ACP methyl ester carboxylesterase